MLDGLAYTLWRPDEEPWGGLVVIHGAGSRKENHHDFARAARDAGMAVVAPDLRGHGESEGALDGRVLDDLAAVADLLPAGAPRALRGSSMGGYLAIAAAERLHASAVVAICPASHAMLLRGLRTNDFGFDADRPSLEAFLEAHPLEPPDVPLLLLHAEGDERVPVEHSRELADRAPQPKLVIVPGGHHRSVQHDAELQGLALRWLRRALA
jgi:alpha-beta hydrolase superfamily lysophospholipase